MCTWLTKDFFSKKVVFELHYHKKRQYGEFQTGKNRSQEIEYTINQSPTVVWTQKSVFWACYKAAKYTVYK